MKKELTIGSGVKGSLILSLLVAVPGIAQDAAESQVKPEDRVHVGAQTYSDPKPINSPPMKFPASELNKGIEGWVGVQMMVDPEGKPYEIEVISTTGTKAFEDEALKAAANMRFEPALLDGKAVDAAIVWPVYFVMSDGMGASREFIKGYKALSDAVDDKDQATAKSILEKLKPRNIYENSFSGVAKYSYAVLWGNERQQIAGLRQAIGGMTTPKYLERKFFTTSLQRLFVLEVRAKDFASALATHKTWIAQKPDPEAVAKLQPTVDKVQAIRTDASSYSVPGQVHEGVWAYRLFKSRFGFKVASGRITQIKLYCQSKYVLFPFDPTLKYTVEKGFGECSIIVYGDTDTAFELIQS